MTGAGGVEQGGMAGVSREPGQTPDAGPIEVVLFVRRSPQNFLPTVLGLAEAVGPLPLLIGSPELDDGIAELAAFATATRLMQAFMVPTLAARYLVERWPVWAPALLAGAAKALPPAYIARRPLTGGPVAVLEGSALADMGLKGKHDERYLGPLGGIEIVADGAANMAALAKGAGLILDCRAYMPTLVRRFAALTLATEEELGAELDRLRFADI